MCQCGRMSRPIPVSSTMLATKEEFEPMIVFSPDLIEKSDMKVA